MYPIMFRFLKKHRMDSDRPQSIRNIEFSIWHTFKRHIPHFLLTIFVDIICPLIVYFGIQKHIKPVYALLIAGTPPFFMVIVKAIISRTFDALGFIVFLGFIISSVVAIITKNPIILLLEKSFVTGLSSLIFAITLIPFDCCHHRCRLRPLAYYFYQDLVSTNLSQMGLPENLFTNNYESNDEQYSEHQVILPRLSEREEVAKVYEWIYTHCSSFRLSCYIITGVWSIGLLSEFFARLTLILIHISINKLFIYGNIILSSVTIICILVTIYCITKERKQTMILIEH